MKPHLPTDAELLAFYRDCPGRLEDAMRAAIERWGASPLTEQERDELVRLRRENESLRRQST